MTPSDITTRSAERTAESGGAQTADSQGRHLHALREQFFDPVTISRLQQTGVQKGWCCLEAGAGSGSIAGWLAEQVGPDGRVIATDVETGLLEELGVSNVEVRKHDLLKDELDTGYYDLVHCRALLTHLKEPDRAFHRLAAALKSGGWLLVEEPDLASFGAADLDHPAAPFFNQTSRALIEACHAAGVMDTYFGRRLRGLAEHVGLLHVESEGTTWIHRGREPAAEFMRLGFQGLLNHPGLSATLSALPGCEAFLQLLEDPQFPFVNATLFAVRGQRAK